MMFYLCFMLFSNEVVNYSMGRKVEAEVHLRDTAPAPEHIHMFGLNKSY